MGTFDTPPPVDIIMYICPNAKVCGNYYAAPEFRVDKDMSLAAPQTRRTESGQEESFSRLECPACRQRGIHVLRVPYIVAIVVPLETAMHNTGARPGAVHVAMGRPMKNALSGIAKGPM